MGFLKEKQGKSFKNKEEENIVYFVEVHSQSVSIGS